MSCNPCNDCPPNVSYVLPDCPGGESCEEISKADCVAYKGPNLPLLGVNNNARLKDVLIALHKNLMLQPWNAAIPYTEWFAKSYLIMVNTTQSKTTVEYIDQNGAKQTASLDTATSTATPNLYGFCALENSPVLVSGSGVLIKGSDELTLEGVSGSGTTLTAVSTAGLNVGDTLYIYSGAGAFAANTLVASIVNATSFTISTATTKALVNAVVVSAGQNICYSHD